MLWVQQISRCGLKFIRSSVKLAIFLQSLCVLSNNIAHKAFSRKHGISPPEATWRAHYFTIYDHKGSERRTPSPFPMLPMFPTPNCPFQSNVYAGYNVTARLVALFLNSCFVVANLEPCRSQERNCQVCAREVFVATRF
jgi:hypothetical protein